MMYLHSTNTMSSGFWCQKKSFDIEYSIILWFIDKKKGFVLTKSATTEYLGGKHDFWYVKIKGISRL